MPFIMVTHIDALKTHKQHRCGGVATTQNGLLHMLDVEAQNENNFVNPQALFSDRKGSFDEHKKSECKTQLVVAVLVYHNTLDVWIIKYNGSTFSKISVIPLEDKGCI